MNAEGGQGSGALGAGGAGTVGASAGGSSGGAVAGLNSQSAGITTTLQQTVPTSTYNGLLTSTTATSNPSTTVSNSAFAPESSSSVNRAAIIGGSLGGLAAILLIAVLAIWLLQRRKTRSLAEKGASTQPVTYARLNESFVVLPCVEASNHRHSHRDDSDYLLPSYAESQSSFRRALNGSGAPSEATISQHSELDGDAIPPAQTTSPAIDPTASNEAVASQRDVSSSHHPAISTPEPPLIAPIPQRPLHQASLERAAQNSSRLRTMSPLSAISTGTGETEVQRMQSQRTVSSVSSMGISVISDRALENLGVGRRTGTFE